jgi:hypothetical protein
MAPAALSRGTEARTGVAARALHGADRISGPPAFLLDFVWPRLQKINVWAQAAAAGLLFLVSFLAVQWPFAEFLMSPWARNWIFGSHYQMYMVNPNGPGARYEFIAVDATTTDFLRGMGIAAVTAMVTSRIGLAIGRWLRGIQR